MRRGLALLALAALLAPLAGCGGPGFLPYARELLGAVGGEAIP